MQAVIKDSHRRPTSLVCQCLLRSDFNQTAFGSTLTQSIRLEEDIPMAEHTPVAIVRRASTWSILWVVLLMVFGMQAVGQKTRVPNSEKGSSGRLIGTWKLVSAGTFRSDGTFEPYPEYGPNPIGYLMYDTTGHMCVSLANPNHRHWANPEKPTDAEKLRSYDVFFAYCGSYEVLEKEGRVIHRPEMGSWPHYIGTDQNRNFRLEADRLILSDEETPPNGERRRYQITWQRVSG
ncbi:MAG: lipocalin-like domain-containing protein [Candidatus Koribacter versatilis]|nr:lipocalin-like domain-containing protein [Candidatus Koribacter versatilis]